MPITARRACFRSIAKCCLGDFCGELFLYGRVHLNICLNQRPQPCTTHSLHSAAVWIPHLLYDELVSWCSNYPIMKKQFAVCEHKTNNNKPKKKKKKKNQHFTLFLIAGVDIYQFVCRCRVPTLIQSNTMEPPNRKGHFHLSCFILLLFFFWCKFGGLQ